MAQVTETGTRAGAEAEPGDPDPDDDTDPEMMEWLGMVTPPGDGPYLADKLKRRLEAYLAAEASPDSPLSRWLREILDAHAEFVHGMDLAVGRATMLLQTFRDPQLTASPDRLPEHTCSTREALIQWSDRTWRASQQVRDNGYDEVAKVVYKTHQRIIWPMMNEISDLLDKAADRWWCYEMGWLERAGGRLPPVPATVSGKRALGLYLENVRAGRLAVAPPAADRWLVDVIPQLIPSCTPVIASELATVLTNARAALRLAEELATRRADLPPPIQPDAPDDTAGMDATDASAVVHRMRQRLRAVDSDGMRSLYMIAFGFHPSARTHGLQSARLHLSLMAVAYLTDDIQASSVYDRRLSLVHTSQPKALVVDVTRKLLTHDRARVHSWLNHNPDAEVLLIPVGHLRVRALESHHVNMVVLNRHRKEWTLFEPYTHMLDRTAVTAGVLRECMWIGTPIEQWQYVPVGGRPLQLDDAQCVTWCLWFGVDCWLNPDKPFDAVLRHIQMCVAGGEEGVSVRRVCRATEALVNTRREHARTYHVQALQRQQKRHRMVEVDGDEEPPEDSGQEDDGDNGEVDSQGTDVDPDAADAEHKDDGGRSQENTLLPPPPCRSPPV
jgi:hypothetical protein